MYYRSGELVVIASIILGAIGLWRLWTTGEKQRAIIFTAAIVAYPIVLYLVSKFQKFQKLTCAFGLEFQRQF